MRAVGPVVVLLGLLACSGDGDDATTDPLTGPANCGELLQCGDGEFCLSTLAPGGVVAKDEVYSCEALPGGCDTLAAMCEDVDPCVPDWGAQFCPGASVVTCFIAVGDEEAVCQD